MKAVEKILGYKFKDQDLLVQAVTHPSTIINQKGYAFERLEFLGDRVLNLVVADLLYDFYPKKPEGELAQRHAYLVSREMCNLLCQKTGLSKFVQFRKSDAKSINLSVAANAFEGILAAMYRDSGKKVDSARKFLTPLLMPYIDVAPQKDAKSALQELAAQKGWKVPEYDQQERSGPDHAPIFTIRVTTGKKSATGMGASRKVAEQNAAKALLESL